MIEIVRMGVMGHNLALSMECKNFPMAVHIGAKFSREMSKDTSQRQKYGL